MFRTYKISSVKFEYRPYFFSAGNGSALSLKSINMGTKMDIVGAQAIPVPLSDYRASLDAKQYDPTKPFKRFYHIGRWAKGRDIGWRNCSEALLNNYGNTSTDCITAMELDCTGYADGALIAAVRVTYYVKFKDRVSD